MKKETIEFNGHQYHRFPDSPHKHLARYYWPSRTDRKKYGLEVLHREMWKAAYGAIPEGCLIHHRDENWLNNTLENFECLTREEHGKRHPQGHPDWLIPHLDRIRSQATEWHRSKEGRAWHREHGKRTWENRAPTQRVCAFCHRPYETLMPHEDARYCSRQCARRWDWAHGVRMIERQCEMCGATFSTSKYRPAVTCGHKCGAALRVRQGTQGGMKRG